MENIDKKGNVRLVGYLIGCICGKNGVIDKIGEAQVFAVPSERPGILVRAGESPCARELKSVVRFLSADELKRAQSAPVVYAAETGPDGRFVLTDERYDGGALDLYVRVENVPMLGSAPVRLPAPACLYLGTYTPERTERVSFLTLAIPSQAWCAIKKKADVWTISGRVTANGLGAGLGAVRVEAFDTDIVQDDTLGTAVTDGNGVYRIDYAGATYRHGTWLDIELFGGPDVYFKVVDGDGNVLLEEPSSAGRGPGRADRSACACIDLSVKLEIPPGQLNTLSLWTNVGTAFVIPDSSSTNDFDAAGYAGAGKFALYGAVVLRGTVSDPRLAPRPREYRFLTSTATADNGTAPVPESSFTRIVGTADDDLFVRAYMGNLIRLTPFKIVRVYAQREDLDAEGWFDLARAFERTFLSTPDVGPTDLSSFIWGDSTGALMGLGTAALTTALNVPDGAAVAGQTVPVSNRIPIEKTAIRFETREVIDRAAGVFAPLPGNGTTLNAMVINNTAVFAKVAVTEQATNPCAILHGSVHLAYTVHHPHLRDCSIHVNSNSGAYAVDLPTTPPLSGNTSPTIHLVFDPSVALPGLTTKCSYLVTLGGQARLHNGESPREAFVAPQKTFYFEP